ncbi:hypothetical protein D9615_007969 [Tricholomella constricta]|uniref:Integrase zinc-binding domain-containing protein n=1 Tax=Tricholomella constricta TaxID=117010 RepID=A0A8H5H271_9AGAR|nr:hypothetical protein D9615_007969 [Tricholomella constricta]
MSPDRQRVPPACSSKPYTRPTTPDTPSKKPIIDIALHDGAQTTVINSKPGFPTYAQYKQIEASYLATLSPSRRAKALISQNLFDKIWAVLHTPDLTSETAQFRFWVRKKFTLGTLKKEQGLAEVDEKPSCSEVEEGQTVLLHEKNLVAVQEQIYDILCYSHGIAGHAGRDKTCLSVRQHYTWIPKELVARFIKACPTCIAKKCGMMNAGDQLGAQSLLPKLHQYLRDLGAEDNSSDKQNVCADVQTKASEDGVSLRPETPVQNPQSDSLDNRLDRVANHSAPVSTLRSLPMAREVSLYQGLPNGWQFRHDDFTAAHDDFMRSKASTDIPISAVRVGRPRIPSIAPMLRAFTVPFVADNGTHPVLQTDVHNAEFDSSPFSNLPMTLQPLQPQVSLVSQIDPALLFSGAGTCTGNTTPAMPTSTSPRIVKARPTLPASIVRAAAPSSIDLDSLSSQKTIQAFLVLRDTHSLTPDSPGVVPIVSPAGSDSSQLSSFPMSAEDSLSPTNTALSTPGDVVGTGMGLALGLGDMVAKDLAEKAGSLMLNIGAEGVCDRGAGVMVL